MTNGGNVNSLVKESLTKVFVSFFSEKSDKRILDDAFFVLYQWFTLPCSFSNFLSSYDLD